MCQPLVDRFSRTTAPEPRLFMMLYPNLMLGVLPFLPYELGLRILGIIKLFKLRQSQWLYDTIPIVAIFNELFNRD